MAVIRVLCAHCGAPVLLLTAPEDGEEIVCPHCGRRFTPDEEEWVDPEE